MVGTPGWSQRIDPEYLPMGLLPPMGLNRQILGDVRSSLDSRRAVQVAALDTAPVSVEDTEIVTPARRVRVRLYRPTHDRALPALLYLHSGAYVLGNLDTDHRRCVDLAARAGALVISVEYRLAPEHPYPAGLDDSFGVLNAVLAAPTNFGVDVGRLAVGGSSAGAGLAAALTLRVRDEIGSDVLKFQLLHQPMLDRRQGTPSMAEFRTTPYFDAHSAAVAWTMYAGPAASGRYLSPAEASTLLGLPPTLVACGEVDPLRDEAIDYARRLLAAQVPTELHVYPRACHGFDSVAPDGEVPRAVIVEQAAALARALA